MTQTPNQTVNEKEAVNATVQSAGGKKVLCGQKCIAFGQERDKQTVNATVQSAGGKKVLCGQKCIAFGQERDKCERKTKKRAKKIYIYESN